MAVELGRVNRYALKHIQTIDKDRLNEKLPAEFASLAEVMLMFQCGYQEVCIPVRQGFDIETKVAAAFARMAGLCLKAAADIGHPAMLEEKTIDNFNETDTFC